MPFTMIVTDAGRAALVNAANTGTAPVTIAQVGLTGTAVTPDVTATNLPGEFKRIATLSGDVVADDTIHLIVRDETGDVFTVRSLALYLGDGTLFAIYGQVNVLVEKSAQALMLLAIDVQFADIDAAALTFGDANFLNPPATTEQQGVVELSTLAETLAGTSTSRVPAEKMVKDAVNAWLDARFGANNAGIWHPGNDGAGSGLDSDMLDGQQGSAFVRNNVATEQYILSRVVFGSGIANINEGGEIAFARAPNGTSTADPYIDVYLDKFRMVGAPGGVTRVLEFPFASGVVWHTGNDGAGSGLDADLLDGQDSSYYVNIPARLGYTPANRAGDVFSGPIGRDAAYYLDLLSGNPIINFDANDYLHFDRTNNAFTINIGSQGRLIARASGDFDITATASLKFNGLPVWHSGNDGAGSGLDADLLDGQQGTYYTDIPGRLGYTPVSKSGDSVTNTISFVSADNADIASRPNTSTQLEVKGNGTGAAVMTFHRPNQHATFLGLDTDNKLKVGGWSAGAVANLIWHAGNDGSGSGLDADTLDGFHASQLLRIIAESKAPSGYMQLSDGLLLQWGRWTSSASPGAAVTVNFPVSFSEEPYTLVTMPVVTTSSDTTTWSSNGISGSAFPGRCSQASVGCRYFAIGPV